MQNLTFMLLSLPPDQKELSFHILEKLRETIADRYVHEDLKSRLSLPDEVTPAIVTALRAYFLDFVYPPPERRIRLEMAFQDLAGYVTKPGKIWRLLGNMSAAVFQFGRHFPAALKAGITSLKAFQDANRFEMTVLQAAVRSGYRIPVSDEQFYGCIAAMPRREADHFISSVEDLLASFQNAVLMEKTIMILNNVAVKMRRYPAVYGPEEVEGIELGVEIIEHGHLIFSPLPPVLKKTVIRKVIENERWFLDRVYSEFSGK